MKKTNDIYLGDILTCTKKIENYVKGMPFDEFAQDMKTQDAVIRNLEVIGEAANKLPDHFGEKHPHFPLEEAVSMRNFLIHEYDRVNLDVVWKTIQDDIPVLKASTEEILEEE